MSDAVAVWHGHACIACIRARLQTYRALISNSVILSEVVVPNRTTREYHPNLCHPERLNSLACERIPSRRTCCHSAELWRLREFSPCRPHRENASSGRWLSEHCRVLRLRSCFAERSSYSAQDDNG